MKCPKCGKIMPRKPIMYGLPYPDGNYEDVVLGGCCVEEDSPKFAYECPVCRKAFVLKQRQLLPLDEDEEEPDDDDIENLEKLDLLEDGL
ncbi:MAG: hypothetical protein ABII75_05090 [Candidatus Omnitrophota bacterium]